MKLQRNNKYAKKITIGLGALIVSLGILTGCNNSSVFPSKDTIVIETINSNDHLKESLNDPDYFSNYFNISEDELILLSFVTASIFSINIDLKTKLVYLEFVI